MNMKSILSIHSLHDKLQDIENILEFAAINQVHLDLVILAPLIRPIVTSDSLVLSDYTLEENRLLPEKCKKQKDSILEIADQKGLSITVAIEIADMAEFSNIITNYANCSDCLVLNRNKIMLSDLIGKHFVKVLMDVSCPTLLLAGTIPDLSDLNTVMVSWDGGIASATAIRHAVPILQAAEDTALVIVDPVPSKEGEAAGDDMALYLVRHGINVTVDLIPSGGCSIAQALFRKAEDLNADLVVMGGYGRSRLREWILGGTTKETLAKADRSVFMAHG
jgi:nucleotide-binding universal stress UspA family protein